MVDALLISDLTNIRWMTGFTGSNGWVVLTPEHLKTEKKEKKK